LPPALRHPQKEVKTMLGLSAKNAARAASLSIATAVATILATAAMAQEATEPTDEEELPGVVVTGSRLVRSDLSAPSPTTVVSEDMLQLSGDTTVESVINELPQLSAGVTSSVNSGGASGVLTANLRGLGATRTLTLVNGRRFIPANGAGNTDLATIPNALVERVEIITGGASAVYGSDAVAGAVNFILKDDFEGFQVSTQFGQTAQSDGESQNYDLVFGANLADGRGNLTLFASHSVRDPVMMEDRDFSRVPLDANLLPSGSGNIPGGRVGLSAAQIASINLGQGPGVVPVGVEGCSATVNSIRFGANGQVLRHCNPETLFNYAAGNYLLRPLDRWQFSGLTRYDVTERVTAYVDLHYALAENDFQQASDSLAIVTGTNPFFEVRDYATNPVLTPDVRALFVNNPSIFDSDGDGHARIADGIARRLTESGLRNFAFERTTVGGTTGLRGDFTFGERTWNWDVFSQFHRSRTDEQARNTMSPARIGLGLNTTTNSSGQVVCVTPVLGCVPVNPFGIDAISPAAAAFITPSRTSQEIFERTVAGGSLAGDLFSLPAGNVGAAIGVEHRDDNYEYMPGATDLAREYGSASRGITRGGYDVSELFGELRIPILADLPFADMLALEGAVRYADYSNFGAATTWRVGAEWSPVEALRFRSAYNRAIRAPAISELFAPITEGFSPGNDPCAAVRNPSEAQRDFCVLQGVPGAERNTFVQTALGFSQLSGGNPDLTEETSDTFTVGAVVRVPWVDRLNVAVDYFQIEVEDAVDVLNAQGTLNACYQLLDANSAPCQAITRSTATGQVFQVRASNSNIGLLSVEGIDLTADYSIGLPEGLAIGGTSADLSFVLNAGWLFERERVIGTLPPVDCAGAFGADCTVQGRGGSPDFKAAFMASYDSGPLLLRTQVRYVGDLERQAIIPVSTPVVADAVTYVDLSASLQLGETFEFFGGIDNAFDEEPPLLGSSYGGDANTDVTMYDVIGRRYFLGVRARF
jgi:iron complex outermembrane recepter protein